MRILLVVFFISSLSWGQEIDELKQTYPIINGKSIVPYSNLVTEHGSLSVYKLQSFPIDYYILDFKDDEHRISTYIAKDDFESLFLAPILVFQNKESWEEEIKEMEAQIGREIHTPYLASVGSFFDDYYIDYLKSLDGSNEPISIEITTAYKATEVVIRVSYSSLDSQSDTIFITLEDIDKIEKLLKI